MASGWVTAFILLAGILTVVCSILLFRLHAFLALILAALLVAAITPEATRQRYLVAKDAAEVVETGPDSVTFVSGSGFSPSALVSVLKLNPTSGRFEFLAPAVIETSKDDLGRWMARFSDPPQGWPQSDQTYVVMRDHQWTAVQKELSATIGSRIATGFGSTATSIGILIAMAAIIGKCLLDSGAADRIVRSILGWTGERGAPIAFVFSGFLLGIPVFFDTVFYLMIPLGKAMRMRTGHSYLLYVLTIVCGGTMAHSLVPPTPGPLVVAEELGVEIGTMILVGMAVGLVAAVFGLFYAIAINRVCDLPLRESPDFSLADLERTVERDLSQLPPLWLSLLPILLPVILISMTTVLAKSSSSTSSGELVLHVIRTLGEKSMALTIAAFVSLIMLVRYQSGSLTKVSQPIQQALASGGVIILITSAGGAFGSVLRQTGIAELIRDLPRSSPIMICTLAFLMTTAIRTAQGSATVAMITAVGVLSGLARQGDLGFHPVYLAAAIGCGSKPIAWMNDSGFWVITRMSG
ncbi:MAG: GntP family permease, partial [Planctomycetaceae bacterium]|nr:GntP family permease [Planctomycetaceae bacterium]